MSFVFFKKKLLFQTPVLAKLNYLSIYFIKQSYDQDTLDEMEYVFLRKRERLRTASLTEMGVISEPSLKFRFPYLKDIVLLELESEKSHRSDRKYCERTLKEILRKGISINNLVSFSVLSELKE